MARKPPPPTITPALLERGWSAPAGCRIRLARPADADAVRALQHVADGQVSPDQEYADTLAAGKLGHLVVPALTARVPSKALLEQVTQHAQAGAWDALGDGISFTLVAESRRGDVVGALLATLPGTLIRGALESLDPRLALMVPVAVLKLRALAVNKDARGAGLGGALLKRGGQLADQAGFFVFYCQVSAGDPGLQGFYTRQGWKVRAPGESISLSERLGLPLAITSQPGEVLAARWRP